MHSAQRDKGAALRIQIIVHFRHFSFKKTQKNALSSSKRNILRTYFFARRTIQSACFSSSCVHLLNVPGETWSIWDAARALISPD